MNKMTNNIKDILEFKASKTEADKSIIAKALDKELQKFNFEEDYLKEGKLTIESSNEVKFHSTLLENYTDNRNITEANRPNSTSVPMGKRKMSEFNAWDYKLVCESEFTNESKSYTIEESHHAIGCPTCKQHGKIRCSTCSGSGENTCHSCSGRGENQCSNCSGRGETKCWSCSGKGTKESGYGDSKRIERCSSCSGRGYKPCSSCRNGYITCSSCSGRGKVTCYTCQGSGDVTCYECLGYRTMDHYFIVTADFINQYISHLVTNPFHGFDMKKAELNNFEIKTKLFDLKEARFKEGYFQDLKTHPLFRQLVTFFDFQDDKRTKLISSRITFFENTYFEVVFTFYGERYTIYLDKQLKNSYYAGKKPSDQYELDLLNSSINAVVNNDLESAKKSIFKLSKYDFIKINEDSVLTAISDTESIYEANKDFENKSYSSAESHLRLVSDEKRQETDFEILIKKLNKVYLLNATVFGLVGFAFILYNLIDKNAQFTTYNIIASVLIIVSTFVASRQLRSIHWSRILVIALLILQYLFIQYFENKFGPKIFSQAALKENFKQFKNSNKTILLGQDSVILTGTTGNQMPIYYLPKGKPYTSSFGQNKISNENYYLDISPQDYNNNRSTDLVQVALRNNKQTKDFIVVNPNDVQIEGGDYFIEVNYIKNSMDDYKNGNTSTTWMRNSAWEAIRKGAKTYQISISSLNENDGMAKPTLQLGQNYQGGIIIYIDDTGEHGLIMSVDDIGSGDWLSAKQLCENYLNEEFDDWRLPTIEELRTLYSNKVYSDNFQGNWYWSSTENMDDSEQAYTLALPNGEEMSGTKSYELAVRAVRSF